MSLESQVERCFDRSVESHDGISCEKTKCEKLIQKSEKIKGKDGKPLFDCD